MLIRPGALTLLRSLKPSQHSSFRRRNLHICFHFTTKTQFVNVIFTIAGGFYAEKSAKTSSPFCRFPTIYPWIQLPV